MLKMHGQMKVQKVHLKIIQWMKKEAQSTEPENNLMLMGYEPLQRN